jgi:hypothetical protein
MSLLSKDITKVKRLSLREVKLPAPKVRVEPLYSVLSNTDKQSKHKNMENISKINNTYETLDGFTVERLKDIYEAMIKIKEIDRSEYFKQYLKEVEDKLKKTNKTINLILDKSEQVNLFLIVSKSLENSQKNYDENKNSDGSCEGLINSFSAKYEIEFTSLLLKKINKGI